MTLLACILIFAAVSLAIAGGLSFVSSRFLSDKDKMRARVGDEFAQKKAATVASPLFKSLDPKALDTDFDPSSPTFGLRSRAPKRKPLRERLENLLEKSDLPYSYRQMVNASGICGIVLGLVASVLVGIVVGLVCGALGLTLPWVYLWIRYQRYRDRYMTQLPTAFDLMARVIRTGQSVPQALMAVADSMEAPISEEFARCQKQQNLGMSPEVSYTQMADRADILELHIFVMAMTIQRQSGGNLSDVLERLAHLLRERQRLQNHVKTLTAEGRLQGLTLFFLPFVVFAALMVVNRSYAVTLFDHMPLLAATGISMTLGMLWIRKIIDIDY